MKKRSSAYSLVIVMLTLGLLIVAITTLVAFLEVGVKTSSDSVERRRVFYVCDGMTRIVAQVLQTFMRTATLAPGVAGATALKTYLERSDVGGSAQLEKLVPDGFELITYDIDNYSHVGDAVPVPSGTFAGLVGKEDKLRLTIQARRADGRFTCSTKQELSLSQIGLFQMTMWSALPQTRFYFSSPAAFPSVLAVSGRVHAQGDLLINAGPDTAGTAYADRISAAGRLKSYACADNNSARQFRVATADISPPVDDGTEMSDAIATNKVKDPLAQACVDADWLGASGVSSVSERAADRRIGVEPLRLPLPTSTPNDPLRFLIEPVAKDPTVDETERHRYAYKADLRIIDGVWYLADVLNRADWPGKPIWSDHPGHVVASFVVNGATKNIEVGQDDLARAEPLGRGWGAFLPRSFSPYGYSVGTKVLASNALPSAITRFALSYGETGGNLPLTGDFSGQPIASGIFLPFAPGFGLPKRPVVASPSCTRTLPSPSVAIAPSTNYGSTSQVHFCPAPWGTTSMYLTSASWGFHDPGLSLSKSGATTYLSSTALAKSYGNVLPININLMGLSAALSTVAGRELGSYFVGRPFNGVIWISSKWPGAWTQSPTADPWEEQLAQPIEPAPADRPAVPPHFYIPGQPRSAVAADPVAAYPALPFPLCSESRAGETYIDADFQIPSCSASYYSATRDVNGRLHAAYPNAVRITGTYDSVFTGDTADLRAKFPNGLTIATNLPAYIAGDYNTFKPAALTAAAAPVADWTPFAVAADSVTLLTRTFRDADAGWFTDGVITASNNPHIFNVAIVTGVGKGRGTCTSASDRCGDNVLSGVRIMENFATAQTLQVNGSIVVGYHSRFSDPSTPLASPTMVTPADTVNWPGSLQFNFDHNLNRVDKQPPGTEALGIQSIKQWERD